MGILLRLINERGHAEVFTRGIPNERPSIQLHAVETAVLGKV